MYLSEHKVKTAVEAAALADDYLLTDVGGNPRTAFGTGRGNDLVSGLQFSRRPGGSFVPRQRGDRSVRESEDVCHFCHKRGHWKRDCAARKSRHSRYGEQVKPAALAAPVSSIVVADQLGDELPSVVLSKPDLSSYLPFISEGHVSLTGSEEKVSVVILRDTGAFDSFVLGSTLPFSEATDTGSFIPVLGMGMSIFPVPVHKLRLHCELFDGEVKMGVRPELPVEGITVILGNDVAGDRVWADQPARPVIVPVPRGSNGPDENEKQFPDVFTACAVTRAVASRGEYSSKHVKNENGDPELFPLSLSNIPLSVSHSELVNEQRADPTLKELFQSVFPADEVKNQAHGYLLQNELLVRKWVPHGDGGIGDPIYQIVVPVKFHEVVLRLSHDDAGHMGVGKTYNRVLRHFFWPRLKKSVAAYIKTCHTCQLTGKPNQTIKVAPLRPIPAVSQPFEHLIIDCVGPLPRSRSGAVYLLTVMCQSTRYPAAYPLRTLTAKAVVRALSQFISIFGIPKTIQSDQGSNFSSLLFAQILEQLQVKHNQFKIIVACLLCSNGR